MALEELVVHEKKIMLQEVATQPDFVRNSIDPMLSSMRKVLATREPGTLRHGFMIGCGDSYCAALAARSYMMEVTGRFVEAVEALEFSRYLVSYIPEGSFVFGVSNSGTVSRTIEGVRLARERGLEQAAAAREMGSRIIVIGAADDKEARLAADIYFPMPVNVPELLSPFVYKLPFEYVACFTAEAQRVPFLGFHNPLRQKVNFRQIFNSAQAGSAQGPGSGPGSGSGASSAATGKH